MPNTPDPGKEIAYLAAALKAPRIRDTAARLADQAREVGWSHEDYLIAVLDREVAARNASGAQLRIRAAGFPARKTLDEFVFDHQPGIRRDDLAPLAAGHYLAEHRNVVLLGPPGTGKTLCETGGGCSPGEDRRVSVVVEASSNKPLAVGRALGLDLLLQSDVWARSATRLVRHLVGATATPPSLAGSALAGAADSKVTLAVTRVGCLRVGYVAALVGAGPAHLPLA